jgi:hypothetical protein
METPYIEKEVAWILLSGNQGFIDEGSFLKELCTSDTSPDMKKDIIRFAEKIFERNSNTLCKSEFMELIDSGKGPQLLTAYLQRCKVHAIGVQSKWLGATASSLVDGPSSTISSVSLGEALRGKGKSMVAKYQTANAIVIASPSIAAILSALCATALARTIVAPLERIKIVMQISPKGVNSSFSKSLVNYIELDGVRNMWRGNWANMLRLIPSRTAQAIVFAQTKQYVSNVGGGDVAAEMQYILAGGVAGVMSCAASFPLDLIRTRLSIQTREKAVYNSVSHGIHTVMKHEGFRGLFKGFGPSLFGVFPYIGFNYAFFEFLKPLARDESSYNSNGLLLCGTVAATVIYFLF